MATFNPPVPQVLVASTVKGDGEVADQVTKAPEKGVAESRPIQLRYLVAAYVLVCVGIVIGSIIYVVRDPGPPVVVAGVGVFAGFYVVAQGLERLLEPFQDWTGAILKGVKAPTAEVCKGETPIKGDKLKAEHFEQVMRKSDLKTRRAEAIKTAVGSSDGATAGAARVAAEMQASVQQYRRNSTVMMWGLSSALAIIVSAAVGLALLHSVGVQDAPMLLDIVITGITIGSGTKPLHDLISSLQIAKDAKKDPDEVGTS